MSFIRSIQFTIFVLSVSCGFAIDLDLGGSIDQSKDVQRAIQANKAAASSSQWSAGMPVDVKNGQILQSKQTNAHSTRMFQSLYSQSIDFSKTFQIKGARGEITAYYDESNRLQIRGVYQGTEFDSGAKEGNKFQGRSLMVQGSNAVLQFYAPGLTVILANSYPLHWVKDEEVRKKLKTKAAFSVLPTAILLSKPTGLETINSFDEVVPLN